MAIKPFNFDIINTFLDKYNICKDDVCLVSSLSLANLGIRDNNDIDIIIKSKVRDEKFNDNNTIIISEYLDVVKSPWSSIYSDNDIINNKDLHQLVNGYKVVIPELVYHKKVWLNRYKDQIDVFEMNEYAKLNDTWNWDIINSHLPRRFTFRRLINSFKNRLRPYKEMFLYRYNYFSKIHNDLYQVIPTNFLLSRQMHSKGFNRYDLMVRHLSIESYIIDDSFDFKLYNKMQKARGTSEYKNPEQVFKNLINSIRKKGFDMNCPIVLDNQLNIINGAHRLTCALYFGIFSVPVQISRKKINAKYGIDWFKLNNFSVEEISIIKKKRLEIFFNNNIYFEVILWPPVIDYFDKIQADIAEFYTILSSKDYTEYDDFENFIRSLYDIDDIKKWKVNMKIRRMEAYPKTFRRILIEIPLPAFRKKESNGNLISQCVEDLKLKIRDKYSCKIDNYFHDIIIHIGDNYEHTRLSKQLINEADISRRH